MRLLFELDKRDYDPNGSVYARPSVRAIIIRGGKLGMVHSLRYNYIKFPGGGIERGEDMQTALAREVLEETGCIVLPDTVRPYGYVHRIEHGNTEEVFIQDNYYFFCDVAQETTMQKLDDYEAYEHFTFKWVTPRQIFNINRACREGKVQRMVERDTQVTRMLISEGLLPQE